MIKTRYEFYEMTTNKTQKKGTFFKWYNYYDAIF